MKPGVARDRVYWASGFVNGAMMAGYFYVLYRSIKSVLDDRADERRYLANVRKSGTPFGPVKSQQYREFLRRLDDERWNQLHRDPSSHFSK